MPEVDIPGLDYLANDTVVVAFEGNGNTRNYNLGFVRNYDATKGRYRIGSLPSCSSCWFSVEDVELLDVATLQGLTKRQDLNGADVRFGAYNETSGRIEVILSNERRIQVLPDKLAIDPEEFETYWKTSLWN